MVVLAFYFEMLLIALAWGALILLNVWVFQKTKAQGNLLMLIGAGFLTLAALIWAFTSQYSYPGAFPVYWMPFIGAVLVVAGFYFTVKPMVDTHLEALKKKLHDVTGEKGAAEPPSGEGSGEGPGASS